MAVILLVAAPISILRSFFLAGYTASVPALVGRSQVALANSYFEAIYSMGFILGPAIAGILAATIGPGPTLAIDAVSFGLSALGLAFVRRDLRAPSTGRGSGSSTEIREGIDYIVASPTLRSSILFWGTVSILTAPLVTALAVQITRDLGLRAVGPRPDAGRLRGRDGERLAAERAPPEPRARRPRSCSAGRWSWASLLVALSVSARSRSCSVSASWPDRPVHGAGDVHHAAHGLLAR